jgi:curved DNA-binding protein CbpA
MSGSAPTRFQDHYSVLGVDPKANSETIQAAYTKLAGKYQPGNKQTGDLEKFESSNLAFEVLSDATLRSSFDQLKGVNQKDGIPKFSGLDFFDALKQGTELRAALLCVLYDRRRVMPSKPSLSIRHLENMLHVTTEQLNFALWYLKQRLLVNNDDKSSLQITVDGMDYLERNPPTPETVMPLVKAEAITEKTPEKEQEKEPQTAPPKASQPPSGRESVLSVLNRALSR